MLKLKDVEMKGKWEVPKPILSTTTSKFMITIMHKSPSENEL